MVGAIFAEAPEKVAHVAWLPFGCLVGTLLAWARDDAELGLHCGSLCSWHVRLVVVKFH